MRRTSIRAVLVISYCAGEGSVSDLGEELDSGACNFYCQLAQYPYIRISTVLMAPRMFNKASTPDGLGHIAYVSSPARFS